MPPVSNMCSCRKKAALILGKENRLVNNGSKYSMFVVTGDELYPPNMWTIPTCKLTKTAIIMNSNPNYCVLQVCERNTLISNIIYQTDTTHHCWKKKKTKPH